MTCDAPDIYTFTNRMSSCDVCGFMAENMGGIVFLGGHDTICYVCHQWYLIALNHCAKLPPVDMWSRIYKEWVSDSSGLWAGRS